MVKGQHKMLAELNRDYDSLMKSMLLSRFAATSDKLGQTRGKGSKEILCVSARGVNLSNDQTRRRVERRSLMFDARAP